MLIGQLNYTRVKNKMENSEVVPMEFSQEMPRAITDVSSWPYICKKGKEYYCIGSISEDRYLMVGKCQLEYYMQAIKMMDGTNTIQSIEEYFLEERKIKIDIAGLTRKLSRSGLIQGERGSNLYSEIGVMGVDIYKRDFSPITDSTRKIITVMWRIIFYASLLIIAINLLGIAINPDKIQSFIKQTFTYKDSYLLGALFATLFSLINIILHEMSHWATAIRFGLQPSQLRITLYAGIFPMWYVKIRGIYTIPVGNRISIMAAGMYANLLLISVAVFLGIWFPLPSWQVQLLSKVMIANLFQIIYCLSPIKLTDGYFIISLLTGIVNLRLRILKTIGSFFNGKRERVDPILVVYFLISSTMILFSTYSTLMWNFKTFAELAGKANALIFKYLIMSIPIVVTVGTLSLFAKQFIKFVKNLNSEEAI